MQIQPYDLKKGSEKLPLSEAKKQSNKKWNDANLKERYDRIQLVVPKGNKERIQVYAKKQGKSLNAFVNDAIEKSMTE